MPIIPTLDCHGFPGGKAIITQLGTDKTVKESAEDLQNRNPLLDAPPLRPTTGNPIPGKYEKPVSYKDVDYSGVGLFAPIVITGHMASRIPVFGINMWIISDLLAGIFDLVPSWAPEWLRQPTDLHAVSFEGKSPKDIVKHLIEKGLPKDYAGVIYLDGCSGGYGQQASFAAEVYRLLVEAGYHYLQVKSNLGEASTKPGGNENVTWPERQWEIKQAEKKRDAAEKAYEKVKDSAVAKQIRTLQREIETQKLKIVAWEGQIPNESEPAAIEDLKRQIAEAQAKITAKEAALAALLAEREGAEYIKLKATFEQLTKEVEDLKKMYEIPNLVGTWGPHRPHPSLVKPLKPSIVIPPKNGDS
jgi:hypothetical protein